MYHKQLSNLYIDFRWTWNPTGISITLRFWMYWSALFTKMFSVHYLAGSLNLPSPLSGSLRRCPPNLVTALIGRFMGPPWGPSGADRTQMGPMLAPWTLLSGRDYSGFRGVSSSPFTSLYGWGPFPIKNWPWQKCYWSQTIRPVLMALTMLSKWTIDINTNHATYWYCMFYVIIRCILQMTLQMTRAFF